MRWIVLIILIYLVVLLQGTVGRVLTFSDLPMGPVGPDFCAMVVVFVALHARGGVNVMLAAWFVGLVLDLTSAGALGPMPFAYAVVAGFIYRVREVFFIDRPITQGLMALVFCIFAHGLWVTFQAILATEIMGAAYGQMLLQVLGLAIYTAVLMPLGHLAMLKLGRLLLVAPAGRLRRKRR